MVALLGFYTHVCCFAHSRLNGDEISPPVKLDFSASTIIRGMELTERFKDALWRATDLHSNQRRKGSGIPYVAHLLGVASLVLEYGGNEDEAIAALLHDAVEDQGGKQTRQMIADKYGETVAQIVDGCTDAIRFPNHPGRNARKRI